MLSVCVSMDFRAAPWPLVRRVGSADTQGQRVDMELSGKPLDLALLRAFSPLDCMKAENLQALASKTKRREAPMGRVLFREGDQEKRTYFLINGVIDLLQEGEIIATIRGGTPEARNPLAHAIPRPYSAVAMSNRVEYLQIDSEFMDVVVTWDQTGAYEVSELRDSMAEEEGVS